MKRLAIAVLFFVSFGCTVYSDTAAAVRQLSEPGGVIVISIPGAESYWEGTAVLEDSAGNGLAEVQGFTLIDTDSNITNFMFILGVPTTAAPGDYGLHYNLEGLTNLEDVVSVSIQPRDFLSEDIPLNQDLTVLRSKPDPRKEEEAKKLTEIMHSFSKSAVFSMDGHEVPVEQYITTSYFGDRRRYMYSDGNAAYSIHAGIDMAAPKGTPVHASGDGKVLFAGTWIVTGNTIVLEHLPGVFGIYFHLDTIAAASGDYVKKDQIIGTVGTTGLSTGAHLHWEMRVGGVAVDPKNFLDTGLLDKAVNLGKHNTQ